MGRAIVSDGSLEREKSLAPSVSDLETGEVSVPIRFDEKAWNNSRIRRSFQHKMGDRMKSTQGWGCDRVG